MNTGSFHSRNSYEEENGSPVLKGSTSAEGDSTNCHKQEWVLFNTMVPSS